MLTSMICGREEASGIPTLLVAPRNAVTAGVDGDGDGEGIDRGIYENGVGDSRGWYEDGAYAAAPASPPSSGSEASDYKGRGRGAQEVYYEALLGRFEALRHTLAQTPPRHAVERLSPDHGCYMSASAKDYKMWRWRLGNTEPKPAQLAGMDKGTVLRLLRMAGDQKGGFLGVDTLVGEGGVESRRVSAWVWGLLARLPDRGELASEEVGVVRDLGKRAVWVGVEMKGVDMGGLEAQMGDAGDEDGFGDEEVVDVEVDREDEQVELEEDDEGFTNRDEALPRNQHHDAPSPEPGNSSSFQDLDAPPIIGPISPESIRGQSSQNFNSINDGDNPDTLTREEEEEDDDDAETLSRARARLLARLESHTAQSASISRDNDTNQQARTGEADGAVSEHGEWSRDDNDGGRNREEEEDEDGEMRDGKGRGEQEEDKYTAIQAAKMLLDMIITIAGEVYGQRDLLEFREVWE
jgi:hypothetical protein